MYEMCKSEPWFAGYFPLIWENFLRDKCQKCAYRGLTCSNAGKISAATQYCGKKVESLSIAELVPYLYFSIFLAFFLDEIPAKSLLCGGESVGMLCAYSLDFKTLMHKEGLTVRASDGVQPTAFLANLFYVQCSELPHFKL